MSDPMHDRMTATMRTLTERRSAESEQSYRCRPVPDTANDSRLRANRGAVPARTARRKRREQ